ncbi:MAG: 50S ribosomal protein L15 [Candidatus Firestonebacteria bacterium]
MNMLSNLKWNKGAKKNKKRIGRGTGSGHGKTSGKGHKGQKSRSGYSRSPGFEGGRMPLIRRTPKRGFKNPFRVEQQIVNLRDLDKKFTGLEEITPDSLLKSGLIKDTKSIKLLGDGDVTKPFKIKIHKFSKSAKQKIEAAGGTIENYA